MLNILFALDLHRQYIKGVTERPCHLKKTKCCHFEFNGSNTLKKVRSWLQLYKFLLLTAHKHLETEATSCWTFGRGLLSHFCLIQDSLHSIFLHL